MNGLGASRVKVVDVLRMKGIDAEHMLGIDAERVLAIDAEPAGRVGGGAVRGGVGDLERSLHGLWLRWCFVSRGGPERGAREPQNERRAQGARHSL
jgi:hypothetical protein